VNRVVILSEAKDLLFLAPARKQILRLLTMTALYSEQRVSIRIY
jgi:hypothetical protein